MRFGKVIYGAELPKHRNASVRFYYGATRKLLGYVRAKQEVLRCTDV